MTIEYKDSKRIVGLSTDKLPSSTYETDFSSTTGWSVESGGITYVDSIHFNHPSGVAMNTGVLYDLTTSNVSETSWTLDYDLNITTSTGVSGSSCQLFIGLSNNSTVSSSAIDTAQDYLGHFMIEAAGTHAIRKGNGSDSPEDPVGTVFSRALEADVLYCRLQRISAIKGTLSLYSDQGRTSLIESKDITITTSLAGLRYLKVILACKTTSGTHVMVGDITNMKFWNTITSGIESKPTNVQDNSILVEKDTARRYWFDKSTPTYESDFSSSTGWTTAGSGVSVDTVGETLDFNCVNGTNNGTSYDLQDILGSGVFLDSEKWLFRCKLVITTSTEHTDPNVNLEIGVSDSDKDTSFSSNRDGIGLQFNQSDGSSTGWYATEPDGASWNSAKTKFAYQDANIQTGTYYIEIRRLSPTSAEVRVSLDDFVTYQETESLTISATLDQLRYLIVQDRNDGSGTGNKLIGTIDDMKIYNGITTTTPATWTKQQPELPTVSGLYVHYDATDVDSITKDSNNRISQWNDKSGGARHLTQATSGNQPLWIASDEAGNPVIDFSDDRYMSDTWSAQSLPNTIFIVARLPVATANRTNIISGSGSNAQSVFGDGSNVWKYAAGSAQGGTKTGIEDTWQYIYALYGDDYTFEIGGELITGTSCGSDTWTGMEVGASSGSQFGNMKIGEIIGYNVAVKGDDKTAIINYLKEKWERT
jgi:hypothetical protein